MSETGIDLYRSLDRARQAGVAQLSGGLSPAALLLGLTDWSLHLAGAPGKRLELASKAGRKAARLIAHAAAAMFDPEAPPAIEPLPGDNRFRGAGWSRPPYSLLAQAFLMQQQWWHNATAEIPGMNPHNRDIVAFTARQVLDVFSPSNNPFTNPEVIRRSIETGGANFLQGMRNWQDDARRQISGEPPAGTENFAVGRDVAITPGKVVYRNRLIELIQYAPATETVTAEPVLIVPAWIMKYYILDLSPQNSLIRHLVGQGKTVFCISWANPGAEDSEVTFDDYRREGVMAALAAINAIMPGRKVHATGYCLGGTLMSIAAAAMAATGDDRLASLTLLAAQTDFSEPGELALFIDDSQMQVLESLMWQRGYLSGGQMAGAFQLLRTNDLVWSHLVHDYLMGERTPMNDLMAWNADATRMPYRMHADYLRRLYLENDLATGRFMVEGRPAALQNIRLPLFVVGTERDHVAPWKSVYKIHYLTDTGITFVLTSGGHNAGIVSEPGHGGRHYRVATREARGLCQSADEWQATAPQKNGSWWDEWFGWLDAHSAPKRVAAPETGNAAKGYEAVCDAPGTYVLQT